jgi:sarcosine oxidase subunit beta
MITEAELLIIGGGIAGASTAYHLARYGQDVILLERGTIASEASGLNAGFISPFGWGGMSRLDTALTKGSIALFEHMETEMGYDIGLTRMDGMQAIHDEEQYEFCRERVGHLRRCGQWVELLNPSEARDLEPLLNVTLPGFIYTPARLMASPAKATQAFASAATRCAARILERCEVKGIEKGGDAKYLVRTSRGVFAAKSLVIAAGAWCSLIGTLLGCQFGIVAVTGQMWACDAPKQLLSNAISSAESALYWHKESLGRTSQPIRLTHSGDKRLTRHLYGRRNDEGELIFGGDRRFSDFSKAVDHTGIEANRAHAAEVLPILKTLPVKRAWAGLMPFSLDGLPVIGKAAQHPNLYVIGGLGASGFSRGPMAGKLLADFIQTGQQPAILAETDPSRFVSSELNG